MPLFAFAFDEFSTSDFAFEQLRHITSFHWYKNHKNRSRNARVTEENKLAFTAHVVKIITFHYRLLIISFLPVTSTKVYPQSYHQQSETMDDQKTNKQT